MINIILIAAGGVVEAHMARVTLSSLPGLSCRFEPYVGVPEGYKLWRDQVDE